MLSLARRKKILELSSEFGIPIVEDDPYSLTSFNGEVNPTLKSMDQNGNVLYISSLSKIVASGLRIGWIIGPMRVIERLWMQSSKLILAIAYLRSGWQINFRIRRFSCTYYNAPWTIEGKKRCVN